MSDSTNKWETLTTQAREFIDQLNRGDLEAASSCLNDQMKASMPGDQLLSVWAGLQEQAGAYQGEVPDEVQTNIEQGFDCVYLRSTFEKAPLFVKIVFQDGKIAGLQFVPEAPPKG